MTQQIHAPYHFVPLSKWVYMPDWAHLVSHDVPFKDGLSGVIDYTLTNKTPLCVGGEQQQQVDGANLVKFARDPMKNPVIPGSSVKGMIRSVLSLATFGKFSQFDDQRFSFRDISSAKGNYLANVIGKNNVQAGWLSFDAVSQLWQFIPCEACKVAHKEIKSQLGIYIENKKTAVEKYTKAPLSTTVSAFISAPRGKQNNRWAEQLGKGNTQGHLVFTNMRIPGRGDRDNYEFSYFFYDHQPAKQHHDIQQQVDDLFANHGKAQVDYLKRNMAPGLGMPVFALIADEKIHSFGFAKMPRVTYQNSTQDLVETCSPAHLSDAYFDMAELMMGTLRDGGLGLKSRVTFVDAQAQDVNASDLIKSNLLVLNSPKPTFYPAYLEQKVGQHYYADYDASQPLSGTKRYIAKQPLESKLTSNAKDNKNVAGQMELCPVGKHFSGKVVFHNLKPVELGALLWSLQLEAGAYHQLGHGKPMGAGAVTLTASLTCCNSNYGNSDFDVEQLVALFISHMEIVHPTQQWRHSPQLNYLLTLSALANNADVNTRYMSIDDKEFQQAKNQCAKLEPFKGLSRNEPLGMDKLENTVSLAFGAGRLSQLIEKANEPWVDHVVAARNVKQKRLEEQLAQLIDQQAQADKKAAMSEHAWKVEELSQQLLTVDNTERAPLIRPVIAFFIENVNQQDKEVCLTLVRLARDNEYHQKPKKKVKEQKQELTNVMAAYGVSL
ncbi:TIGR03986 family CRISPR-associated RAMP protein [Photobacterium carnosum]|uniref:TIGR03986 family type III CRISPR-associated RAMP protein n=1 Tax=Photobacterium carnosum TaxID=2023717 RepID=UPI001E2CAB33|nr:TIGR03986 family CRISPR-associated RAMP protein [Photobacterium carnosum]MCD9527516.1 TIGR03986 family CRISPR-associated RAMP protein [Photobacterium carnosum]